MRGDSLWTRLLRHAGLGVLATLALALLAWGPHSGERAPPGRTIVTYWEKWTDFEGAAMRAVVDQFNSTVGAQRGIFVQYIAVTGVDLKTAVAITGGDPPDLAGLWQRNLYDFASAGGLQALDERVRGSGMDPADWVPVFAEGCRYHDKLYAVPLTPASIALYYNRDLFAAEADRLRGAGLDPDAPPRTIAELDAFANVLCKRNARGDLERMAYIPASPDTFGWFWNSWPIWFGASLVDPGSKHLVVDSPGCVAAYTWVEKYAARFGQRAVTRFEAGLGNFNSAENPFMTGQLAMAQQGPWFANMIRHLAPQLHYGVAPFPTFDGEEAAFCEQDILVLPRGARHAEEAWVFASWLYQAAPLHMARTSAGQPALGFDYAEVVTPEGWQRRPMPALRPVEWLCWMHNKNNPLNEPSPGFMETHPNPAIAVHERIARTPRAVMLPALPNLEELMNEFVAAYRDIWLAGAPAEARLRACQRRLDKLTLQTQQRLALYGASYP
jgi:ABC-type glycerol-3-phosphate transport system substrate-binding protein